MEDVGAISISEVSDVTEIKSLSENPRNMFETTDSSRTWKDRLMDVEENDDTKYRSLDVEKLRQSKNPLPLKDEIPERSDSAK